MQLNNLKWSRPQAQILFNLPQLHGGTFIMGRGTGKSSSIAWFMHRINKEMPRSAWGLQGVSFQQILTVTLPGTLAFLEYLGYVENHDFFVGSYPKNVELPYHRPRIPNNTLFLVNHQLRTSVAFTFFSQDKKASPRGASRDGIITDESLLLDPEKFAQEAKATVRGNEEYFGRIPWHHGVFHFSSMPQQGSWLLKTSEHYYKSSPDLFLNIDKRIDLQMDFLRSKNTEERIHFYREICTLSNQIKFYPHNHHLHLEYNAFDAIDVIGIDYLFRLFEDIPAEIFEVEVLNRRIYVITQAFYPNLNRNKHCYYGHFDYGFIEAKGYDKEHLQSLDSRQDSDVDPNAPLYLGMDFGTDINWIIVGQYNQARNQLTIVHEFYCKAPKTFLDNVEKFCNYYLHHKNKTIFLYPDGEGNIRRANLPGQPTYVDQIRKVFSKYKWSVHVEKETSYNPDNHTTFRLIQLCLSQDYDKPTQFPKIKFNALHCKTLVAAMERTPAINIGSAIKKNKTSERKFKTNREEATDSTDAFDQIIINKFGYLLKRRDSMGTPGSL